MKKLSLIILVTTMIITTSGCGQSRIEDLADDIDLTNQSEEERYIPLPSNKEQNRHKLNISPQVESYADEYGFQLDQMYLQFNKITELFYSETITQSQIDNAKESVSRIQDLSQHMQEMNPPDEFKDLYIVHEPLDIELDSLAKSLEEFDPNNDVHFRRARLYFESAVTTHKVMELEYRVTLEELGIK